MIDRPLSPADLADVRDCLAHALRFGRNGKRTQAHEATMAAAAAEHVLEALRLSGFIVMREPPAEAHPGVDPAHSRLGITGK